MKWPALSFAVCAAAALGLCLSRSPVGAASADTATKLDQPDAVCARCHEAIYDRYERSAMAQGSGLARDGLLPGGFHHAPSGIDYSVFAQNGAAWMRYARGAKTSGGALSGEEKLEFYVGSGHRGRTYLFQREGQWFELPINYYTRRKTWDMAPAFDAATTMPAPLPVDPNCLHCHVSELQASEPTARSRYASVPFRQGGIGCSACHGDAAQHLAQMGHGAIVNPGKLSVARRDSGCIQCHLEGDAVIYRAGKSLAQFRAGDDLGDFAVYFVRAGQQSGGARATSQYEALLRSACKRASGDKLTCTSCHDPHGDPALAERVQYFRAKCLNCHTNPAMTKHHAEQQDCAQCHMPSRDTTDISHEQVTDHDIEAKPIVTVRDLRASEQLVPVGTFQAGDREYGLAYAQLAEKGDRNAADLALKLLNKAAQSGVHDETFEVRLGFLEQLHGDTEKARAAYRAALTANPYEPTALANLAVIDAGTGRLTEAVHLLERLIEADPTQTPAGLNLAYIDCQLGRPGAGLAVAQRIRQANPDDPLVRAYLKTGDYAGGHCQLQPEH